MKTKQILIGIIILLLLDVTLCIDEVKADTEKELAKKLANPVGSLISVSILLHNAGCASSSENVHG